MTAPGKAAAATVPIAYLCSGYPAVSHTFVLGEVVALRARGLSIAVASVNPPDRPPDRLGELERAEADATFYVKRSGPLGAFSALFSTLARRPGRCLAALGWVTREAGPDLGRLAYGLAYFAEALLVGRWMERTGARHLHVHFANPASVVGALVRRIFPVTFSMTIHGSPPFHDEPGTWFPATAQAADFICCISRYSRSQVWLRLPPAEWEKVEITPMGVDTGRFRPPLAAGEVAAAAGDGVASGGSSAGAPEEGRRPEDRTRPEPGTPAEPHAVGAVPSASSREDQADARPHPAAAATAPAAARSPAAALPLTVLCVGRLAAVKGFPVLLDATARARSEGHDVRLRLVGDGPERPLVESRVRALGLCPYVTLAGALNHDEVLEQYWQVDAFALASFSEGVPVVLMEAMACELPCVATGVAGIPELIRDGQDGLLVPPGDPEALAAALARLAGDAALRRRLAASARERVRALHDGDAVAERMREVLSRRLAPLHGAG